MQLKVENSAGIRLGRNTVHTRRLVPAFADGIDGRLRQHERTSYNDDVVYVARCADFEA